MSLCYQDERVTLINDDCIETMRTLPDNSVDSIVTDPPYGLGFMGKGWDALPPGLEWAEECLRVLKPGGHLLAFGGTRTWHRLAVAVEDAGFEIRDSLAWLYGSGFPKSMDVSKAIDKTRDDKGQWREIGQWLKIHRQDAGFTRQSIAPMLSGHRNNDSARANMSNWENGLSFPTWDRWEELKRLIKFPDDKDQEVWRLNGRKGEPGEHWKSREVLSERDAYGIGGKGILGGHAEGAVAKVLGASKNVAAAQWEGWGTALKPAFEPVVMGRKPLVGTVAANVLEHSTGALNIDASRIVPTDPEAYAAKGASVVGLDSKRNGAAYGEWTGVRTDSTSTIGRHPANVLLDESQAEVLEEQSGASRFFYTAKASKAERPVVNGVAHETVKPLAIMRYLVKLVTPPGGTVLEPFAGSGTTVEACILEGFKCIAIEREAEYLPLIEARINRQGATDDSEPTFDIFEGAA